MNKIYFITIIFALILTGFIGLQFFNKSNENRGLQMQTPILSESVAPSLNLETQINSEGGVEVSVTPKSFSNKEWLFGIALNTHSKELTADLVKSVILIDDKGNEYKPIDWQGDPPGGHHRSGILKFNSISSQPTSITIKILEVGGIKERDFVWQLK